MINLSSSLTILNFLKKETEHQLSSTQTPFGSGLKVVQFHHINKRSNCLNRIDFSTSHSKETILIIYSNKSDVNQVFFYYFPKLIFSHRARVIQSLLKLTMQLVVYEDLKCNIIKLEKPIKNLVELNDNTYNPWVVYFFLVPILIATFVGLFFTFPLLLADLMLVTILSAIMLSTYIFVTWGKL